MLDTIVTFTSGMDAGGRVALVSSGGAERIVQLVGRPGRAVGEPDPQ